MDATTRRRLPLWIALSALVHALALSALPAADSAGVRRAPPGPLQVRLGPAPGAAPEESAAAVPPPHPRARGVPARAAASPAIPPAHPPPAPQPAPAAAASRPPPPAPQPAPAAAVSRPPPPAPAAAASRPPPPAPIASAAAPRPAPAAASAAPRRGVSTSAARAPREAGVSGELHTALLDLLHREISRHKRYPLIARRQRREGTATVRFNLHPDGQVDGVEITRSSGFNALDQAARYAVDGVAPFGQASRYLSAVERFEVDVVFRLY